MAAGFDTHGGELEWIIVLHGNGHGKEDNIKGVICCSGDEGNVDIFKN